MSPGSEPVWIAIKMLDHDYVCDKIKNAQKGILRRWYSRKHQKSVSSLRHSLHWQNLSDVNILELWVLLKACNFQGGRLRWSIVIHFGPFQLLAEQQLLIPPRLSPVQTAVHVFLEQLAQSLQEPGWTKKKDPVLQILEICVLWLLIVTNDHRGADKDMAAIVVVSAPHCCKPYLLCWCDFQGVKS